MSTPNKLPWISPFTGRFEVKNPSAVKRYLAFKTGLPEKDIEVVKADRYIVINATVTGKLISAVVNGHLSTMSEFDFAHVVEGLTPKP